TPTGGREDSHRNPRADDRGREGRCAGRRGEGRGREARRRQAEGRARLFWTYAGEARVLTMTTIKVAIAGASGRMGRALIEEVLRGADVRLAAALEQRGNAAVGRDAGESAGSPCGVRVSDDVAASIDGCDVLIDFTRPEGTLAHVVACARLRVKMVIGTTGFSEEQRKQIAEAARGVAIAMAPNFSVGVNVMFRLLDIAARSLAQGYDIEILEAHHRHKVDAPSGTALR